MPQDKIKIAFFGTPDFSVPCLEALCNDENCSVKVVITQPDRPSGRGGKISSSPVKRAALTRGIDVLQPGSIKKDPSFVEQLKVYGPLDVGVVVAFGQILPISVLNTPSRGSVNVHASLLPRWRGAAPIQRAILAGDTETGVCLMQMEAGLDTGAVISRESIPITGDDDAGTLHDKLSLLGAKLLVRDISSIAKGEIKAVSQPEEGVTYAEKIKSEEGHINWGKPAGEIVRLIRAFSPFPSAYCTLRGMRLKIFKAEEKTATNDLRAAAGSIAFLDNARLEIACESNSIELKEVQLEGKRRMGVAEFLNGIRLNQSDRFE